MRVKVEDCQNKKDNTTERETFLNNKIQISVKCYLINKDKTLNSIRFLFPRFWNFVFFNFSVFLILYFQPDNGPFQAETFRENITFNICEWCVAHRGKHTFSLLFNFYHALWRLATYDSHNIKLLISEMVRQYILYEVGNGPLRIMNTNYFIDLIIQANHNLQVHKR